MRNEIKGQEGVIQIVVKVPLNWVPHFPYLGVSINLDMGFESKYQGVSI